MCCSLTTACLLSTIATLSATVRVRDARPPVARRRSSSTGSSSSSGTSRSHANFRLLLRDWAIPLSPGSTCRCRRRACSTRPCRRRSRRRRRSPSFSILLVWPWRPILALKPVTAVARAPRSANSAAAAVYPPSPPPCPPAPPPPATAADASVVVNERALARSPRLGLRDGDEAVLVPRRRGPLRGVPARLRGRRPLPVLSVPRGGDGGGLAPAIACRHGWLP